MDWEVFDFPPPTGRREGGRPEGFPGRPPEIERVVVPDWGDGRLGRSVPEDLEAAEAAAAMARLVFHDVFGAGPPADRSWDRALSALTGEWVPAAASCFELDLTRRASSDVAFAATIFSDFPNLEFWGTE